MNFHTLNRLYTGSTRVLYDIQGASCKTEVQHKTHELFSLRRQFEEIKFHKIAEVIQNIELYRMAGMCQKQLLTAQFNLINKALPLLESDEDLYARIESIFRAIYGEMPSIGFGKNLVKEEKTHLFVLDAVNQLTSKEKIANAEYNTFVHQYVDPAVYGGASLTSDNIPFFSIVTICSEEDLKDPKLADNLKLGREALRYAIEKIPYSSNFYNRENGCFPVEKLDQIEMQLGSCRELFTEKTKELTLSSEKSNHFQKIRRESEASDYCFIGNCTELSSVAFAYLIKQGCMPVEMYTITGGKSLGKHTFVIQGRKDHDPAAVVVDAWRRHVYPAKYLPHILEDCLGTQTVQGVPKFQKFDPSEHKLNLICQYVLLPENYHGRNAEVIKQKLMGFHAAKTQDEKKMRGAAVRDILTSTKSFLQSESSRELRSQLDYFLE